MSDHDVSDIRERLARMEERQTTICGMLERSLSSYGDLANRVTSLEKLKGHFYLAAALVGAVISIVWEGAKMKFGSRG